MGNHSSGKMGFALADELANLGADVTLIAGPSSQQTKNRSIYRINVTSAAEMLEACMAHFANATICIMSAAIADYTPITVAEQKIKKQNDNFSIDLKKTTDILKTLGEKKRANQILVGFALETNDEEKNAIEKLKKKNLDFIVLNSLNDEGAGFKADTNKITIIDSNFEKTSFGLKTKQAVAADICQKIIDLISK